MKTRYLVLILLAVIISFIFVGTAVGGCPEGEEKCCNPDNPSECSCVPAGSCSSSGGGSGGKKPGKPGVVIPKPIPEDGIGGYYIDENGNKQYVQYKTWDECMKAFNDAGKCSRIVTDPCESCMGTCLTIEQKGDNLSRPCSVICKDSCGDRGGTVIIKGPDSAGGEDEYGRYYYEGGVKKYSVFNDFRACWSILGDAKECAGKYGYYCGYKNGFYVSYLCNWDDDACRDKVISEYAAACE